MARLGRRPSKLVEWNGKSQPILDWCQELNLLYHRTKKRIYAGWPPSVAFAPEPFAFGIGRRPIPRNRFKMIEHLLSQRVSRRTIMRQAHVHRLTVDWIAKGIHTRQRHRERYEAEQRDGVRCPHCGARVKKLPCLECSMIKFKGV